MGKGEETVGAKLRPHFLFLEAVSLRDMGKGERKKERKGGGEERERIVGTMLRLDFPSCCRRIDREKGRKEGGEGRENRRC